MWCFKLIILLFCLKDAALQSSCKKHTTCSDCILDQSGCVWCELQKIDESRCMPESIATSDRCPSNMLQNPKGSAIPLENKNEDSTAKQFHLLPQKYNLNLRPGQPHNFNFIYKSTKNYPVDVYFLIDASRTMQSIKEQTANQSENIYKALNIMSNDVKLGFGTFVDKNALPYTSKTDSSETYSFKHRLSLTENYGKFEELLKSYSTGSNYDKPEGGLDAVCQAMACEDIIGWRKTSAKIIVYLSDGPFHAAGDGRMAGIFTPYDGKCYTVDNVYTKELEMDYPTVGMVNKLAIQTGTIILFAVTEESSKEYKALSSAISESKLIIVQNRKDSSDSNEIMETLTGIYENITTAINLKVNMRSGRRKNFNITFEPDCTRAFNEKDKNEACKIKPNVDVEHKFTGTITLLEHQAGVDEYGIDVAVEGYSEKLSLDVKVIKTCDCESKPHLNSSHCNGDTFECGICICRNGKYGENCNCLSGSSAKGDNSTCIHKGDNVECSGHGHCDCGLCKCNEGFDGRYCECIKNSCELINGLSCGGEGRGKCECGTCKCDENYMGEACQCYRFDEACKAYNDKKICSGRGNCDCGKCKCNKIPEWDKRTEEDGYCTMLPCTSCHNLQCSYIEACVICLLNTNISCPCQGLDIEEVTLKDMENITDWNACSNIRVDVGCYTKFLYKYNDDEHRILMQMTKEKNCAESHYIIGGAVLGSLLLIGILTLIIWKVTSELSYRREYSKFVDAHKDDLAGTCENPLYESPTTTFRNPAFRKRSFN